MRGKFLSISSLSIKVFFAMYMQLLCGDHARYTSLNDTLRQTALETAYPHHRLCASLNSTGCATEPRIKGF
ncbi:hypothetical protein B5X24_HaOG206168 [Helicoverpa armigera]|nr:hypothetical protein B5X24_HaOG206168 [Helicoverpa armigera]